ncbi:MAG: uroporphyrinogen-III synthase [Planctomycetota bacterium]
MPGKNLGGSRWILTRPQNRSKAWCDALLAEGAEVLVAPALELLPAERSSVRSSILNLKSGGLLVFTSATTVVHFFSSFDKEDQIDLEQFQWAAVGPATAEAIRSFGQKVSIEGEGQGADDLVDQIVAQLSCCEVVHYTSDAGLAVVVDRLQKAGFSARRVEASCTQVDAGLDPESWNLGAENRWSGIIFTSPASIRAVLSRIGMSKDSLLAIPAVAAGNTTAKELEVQGWKTVEIAKRATPGDLVVACTNLLRSGTMDVPGEIRE